MTCGGTDKGAFTPDAVRLIQFNLVQFCRGVVNGHLKTAHLLWDSPPNSCLRRSYTTCPPEKKYLFSIAPDVTRQFSSYWQVALRCGHTGRAALRWGTAPHGTTTRRTEPQRTASDVNIPLVEECSGLYHLLCVCTLPCNFTGDRVKCVLKKVSSKSFFILLR